MAEADLRGRHFWLPGEIGPIRVGHLVGLDAATLTRRDRRGTWTTEPVTSCWTTWPGRSRWPQLRIRRGCHRRAARCRQRPRSPTSWPWSCVCRAATSSARGFTLCPSAATFMSLMPVAITACLTALSRYLDSAEPVSPVEVGRRRFVVVLQYVDVDAEVGRAEQPMPRKGNRPRSRCGGRHDLAPVSCGRT
jgi:hypothetical protein